MPRSRDRDAIVWTTRLIRTRGDSPDTVLECRGQRGSHMRQPSDFQDFELKTCLSV
jgi:hypothetical protein